VPSCPACHADLEGSAAFDAERPVCPFCGVELSGESVREDRADSAAAIGSGDRSSLPTLPDKSRIEIVEASAERLVLHVPPGGEQTGGIGCFALAWNGFMCVFTPPWFFAMKGGNGPPLYFIVPFLMVFWGVGLGMAFAWLRMKKLRTYVLIEPDRVVLQKDFLGRKSTQETPLTEGSRASLVESYQVNDRSVYAVTVRGQDRTVKFGTQLSEPEKAWLVEAINGFLTTDDVRLVPAFCSACGERLPQGGKTAPTEKANCPACGAEVATIDAAHQGKTPAVPRVLPEDIAGDSPIRIEEAGIDRLRFSLPLLPDGGVRTWLPVVIGLVGIVWGGFAAYQLFERIGGNVDGVFEWVFVAINGVFVLPGVALFVAAWVLRRGRIRVSIDHDWLAIRWGLGPAAYQKRLVTVSIERVRLSRNMEKTHRGLARPERNVQAGEDVFVAAVEVGETALPLTTFHPLDIARQAAGLVKTHLEGLGVRLAT
jgi:hypothetical protein